MITETDIESKADTKTKVCATCERTLTLDKFRGYPKGGHAGRCYECMGNPRYQRSAENPYVLRSAKPGEPQKHCTPCDRDIPLAGFARNRKMPDGLAGRCQDCEYLANSTGTPYRMVPDGPPLKRSYYVEKVINGTRMIVREIR